MRDGLNKWSDFQFSGVIRNMNSRPNDRHDMKDNTMKTLKKVLLAAAVVAIGTTLSAKAGEPLYSPKAKELAAALRKVPIAENEPNLAANLPNGNAKAWEVAQSLRRVPGTGTDIDLAHATRPMLSPKDPRFEVAWRENAEREFQIAPVK